MTDYLTQDQAETFVQRLLDLSRDGRMTWVRENSDFQFRARVKDFQYRLRSSDNDDYHPFSLGIWQRFRDDEDTPKLRLLQKFDTGEDNATVVYELLAELYQTVKRLTLGIDQVAMDIMHSLDDL